MPRGELDLVMMDGDILAFVEVRGRRGDLFGSAAESVTRDKQSRLIRAAEFFLAKRPKLTHHGCRFDVIAVDLSAEPTRLEWIKDAFDAG